MKSLFVKKVLLTSGFFLISVFPIQSTFAQGYFSKILGDLKPSPKVDYGKRQDINNTLYVDKLFLEPIGFKNTDSSEVVEKENINFSGEPIELPQNQKSSLLGDKPEEEKRDKTKEEAKGLSDVKKNLVGANSSTSLKYLESLLAKLFSKPILNPDLSGDQSQTPTHPPFQSYPPQRPQSPLPFGGSSPRGSGGGPQTPGLSPFGQQGPMQRYSAGNPASESGAGPQQLATPYSGPGGAMMSDCEGFPKGPIAYNIRNKTGSGVTCNAASVVSGYMGQLRKDKFGIGYINPMRESGDPAPGTILYKCSSCGDGEYRYPDYNSQDAVAYVQTQLLHWQRQGIAKKQSCVPVDIDNCDAIGSANYLKILKQVQKFNNQPGIETKIMVLNKNPQNNCNFFSHPTVIGAFIEEISLADAQKVSKMRSKSEQVLLFAAGSGSKAEPKNGKEDPRNENVRKIEKANPRIPNASFSYDKGKEYEQVYDCTYNP